MLKELFKSWKAEHFPNTTLYEDGIINETEYTKQATKLLFVAKEPNGSNHKEENGHMSFCEEWNGGNPNYPFALRIADWSIGIMNNFPEYSNITDVQRHNQLKTIAFMNIKKSRGTGSLHDVTALNQLANAQINYLHRQIDSINPELVVLCLSRSHYLRQLLFPESTGKWKNSGYGIDVSILREKILIDFYHPSSRIVPAASYSLLQNVIKNINASI